MLVTFDFPEWLTADRAIVFGCSFASFLTLWLFFKLIKCIFCTMSPLGTVIWKELNETPIENWTPDCNGKIGFRNDKLEVYKNGETGSYYRICLLKEDVTNMLWIRDKMHIEFKTQEVSKDLQALKKSKQKNSNKGKIEAILARYKKGE